MEIKKASIHHHFPTKEDLINALLNRYISKFNESLKDIVNSKIKAKSKLQKFMSLFSDTLEDGCNDKTCLCGMLAAELLSLTDESSGLVKDFLNISQATIQQILKEGQEDSSFKFKGNPKTMSELILSTLEGGLFLSRVDGGPEKFKKIIRQIDKIVTRS